jgi:periplasmic copper chaperone A
MKRLALLLTAALAALLATAGPALAHVTVTAPGAASGGSDQEITFRVPVEKDVDTVGLTLALPTDTPIASVEIAPLPGWTHTEKTTTLATPIKTDDGDITSAVSEITWTATGDNGIKPGEFGSFTIIAGQLPAAKSLTFKALQKYRDGTVTKWIETAAPGSSVEPQNPAPVLALAPKGDATTAPTTAPKAAGATGNTGPVVLSIIALVAAVGALGLALVTRART